MRPYTSMNDDFNIIKAIFSSGMKRYTWESALTYVFDLINRESELRKEDARITIIQVLWG